MTPDIFLSYTREDQATAQRFAEAFEAQGFSVWWDATLRSGEAYDQVTEEALRTAKAVVVLWSQKSVVSRWVRAEATLADRNRTLVPAMIEPCERPIMFELTQTADLCRWTGEAGDPAWRTFLADVRKFVEAGETPAQQAKPPTKAAPMPPQQSARPSVAILPFINRSGLAEDEVFAEDMVNELTAALSGSFWMKIVAASGNSIYRGSARDLRQIGRELGVRYLLDGVVRRAGDARRVTAQLVEAGDGDVLWVRKFDRPLDGPSAQLEDLAAEVASHVGVQVERAERERALQKLGDLTGREAALRANSSGGFPARSSFEAAVAQLKRAVELNPNDGANYALLAAQQGQLLHHSGGDDPALAREIAENIRKARALDPNNPAVLMWIGGAFIGLRKLQDALPPAQRAVDLNPSFEIARFVLGAILARLGRSAEALAELDAGDRLTPNSFWFYLSSLNRSIALFLAGRLDAAREAADQALPLLPGPELLIQSSLCLAKANQRERARDALRRLRDTDPDMSRSLAEGLVSGLYCACNAAQLEDYVATVRELWDETSSEPKTE
jgi:TolB-like protein